MTSITINLRNMAIALAAIGLTLGTAFGAGIAYGRTDDAGTTSTTPNIEDLIAARGGGSGAGGNATAGLQSLLGSQGAVTAIDGDTITITTAQGSKEIHATDSTTISLLQPVSLADLTVGSVIIVSGEERDDGSVDATAIDEVPPQYQALTGGAGQGGGNIPGSGSGATGSSGGAGPTGSSGAPGPSGAAGGTPGAGGGAAPPTATLETAPIGTPSATPQGDRTDCDEIRGTDYRSESEREFFLENCVEAP